MLNIKSRRKYLQRKSRLLLYLEMKDSIQKGRANGSACFSRSSSACEYWRQPSVVVGENVSRHRRGLLVECADTNVLCKNTGQSQEDIDLHWNNMKEGCLRSFFFNGGCTDEMGNADGTPDSVSYVPSKEGYGYAVEGNGTTSSVNCGSGSDIDDLASLSIAFLMNPMSDGENDQGCIADKGALRVWVSDESSGLVRLNIEVQYDTQSALSTSEQMIPVARWGDVAVTYGEDGDRKIRIFLDGAEVAYQTQQASQGSRTSDAANSLYLLNNSAGDRCFDGQLDRFTMWNRVLNHEEVRRLAQNGIAALWNFEDNCDDELGIHHGNPTNVTFTDGENSRAAAFLENDSLVTVPKTPFIQVYQNMRRFSVRAKIRVPTRPSATSTCYLVHKYSDGLGWVFGLRFDEDGMRLWGIIKAPTDAHSESTTKMSYGNWHEVAFSYDDFGDRRIHLWADAAEITYATQDAASGDLLSDANMELVIGNLNTTTDKCLYGYIETVTLYKRPLVTSELGGGEMLCLSRDTRPILSASGGSWDRTTSRDPILLMNENGEVEKIGSQHVLYYTGGAGYLDQRIGRAVSDDGIHWEKSPSAAPVLDAGDEGSWDEKYVSMGTVIRMTNGWHRLYYAGRDDYGNFGLGLATSSDGINFARHSGNPLIMGDQWNTNTGALGVPYVVKLSTGQWALMFESNSPFAIYLGLSDDGVTWSPANSGDPVMEGTAGEWDSNGVANPKLFELSPEKYLLGFNGQAGNAQWNIGFAYSTDLSNWTKFVGNPVVVRGPAEWEAARIENAFIAKQDVGTDEVRMWYFGGPDATHFRIGYATCKQGNPDILDLIDVTGWEKHVEPNLYDNSSIQLAESGGSIKRYYQVQKLSQGKYVASLLAYKDGSAIDENDIEICASGEIVENGGFEADLSAWMHLGGSGGTGSATHDTGTTHEGSAGSMKLTHSNSVGDYRARQALTLISGRTYNVSCWVYIPSANVPSDSVKLGLDDFTDGTEASASLATTDSWQQLTISDWEPGADSAGQVRVSVDDSSGGGGAFVYFDDVTVTEVHANLPTTFEHQGKGVYRAWSLLTGGANNFELGVELKANRRTHVSLLTCVTAGVDKASGPYPRSPIINNTTESATRESDSLTVGGSTNFNPERGTLDIEFYPLFPSDLAGTHELCFAHFDGGTGDIILFKDSTDEIKFRVRGNGDEDTATGTIAWDRDDRVKIRAVWDSQQALDGANYMLVFGRVNDGEWSQIGGCSSQPTPPSPQQTLYIGRRGDSLGYEANSFISWLRIYKCPLAHPTW